VARILVIEDEPSIRALYLAILRDAGHEAAEAPDGAVGVRLFRENPADVVITDIIMPEKEGIEVIMELRRDFPDVKIIAVSGGGKVTTTETCLRLAKSLGAVLTIAKPVSPKELLTAVGEVLDVP
jgi:DNA-binding response OmpR family regulator